MTPQEHNALVDRLGGLLERNIRPVFKGEPNFTLFVRFPDDAEGTRDVMVTGDNAEGIRAIFERSMKRAEQP